MIRLRCPACGKSLKAPERLAGRKVACPRCDEQALVPEVAPESVAATLQEAPESFPTMSSNLRLFVAAVAAAGLLGLGTATVWPLLGRAPWITHGALGATFCSFLVLFTVLHGHGTGCPRCGKWWARTMVKSEVGEREVASRSGATFARSVTRTHYRCQDCGHAWLVTDSEEYRVPEETKTKRPRKQGG